MPLGVQRPAATKSLIFYDMETKIEVVLVKVENKDAIEIIPAFDQMARGLSHLLLSYERGTVFLSIFFLLSGKGNVESSVSQCSRLMLLLQDPVFP